MQNFPDIMLDLETTGTSPDESAIIQIACVRFNLKLQTVDTSTMFDRCLNIPPKRHWDESTRGFWMGKNRAVYEHIRSRMEPPKEVFDAFIEWANKTNFMAEPQRVWAKPTSFDCAFIESYTKQFGHSNPFHYRSNVDVNSFIRGLANDWHAELNYVPYEAMAHHALVDVLSQIKNLFAAVNHHRPSKVDDVIAEAIEEASA